MYITIQTKSLRPVRLEFWVFGAIALRLGPSKALLPSQPVSFSVSRLVEIASLLVTCLPRRHSLGHTPSAARAEVFVLRMPDSLCVVRSTPLLASAEEGSDCFHPATIDSTVGLNIYSNSYFQFLWRYIDK